MTKKHLILVALFLLAGTINLFAQYSNDTCSQAVFLCANNTQFSSTIGGTHEATDPALDCGDGIVDQSTWFTVTAISTGTLTINLSTFNAPGLAMEIYTGSCGALTAVPGACGASATNFGITFNVTAGTTYYIMVDGESANETDFNISATGNTIIALPDPNFAANPNHGCGPLSVLLHNSTILNGGTGITYNWSFDGGPSIPWTTTDTTVGFASIGVHTAALTVCNAECGCKTETQNITVQHVTPSYTHTPTPACLGEPITFKGSAFLTPPFQGDSSAHVSSWKWFFDDLNSGSLDSASGQTVIHTFIGSAIDTCFNVRLVIHGYCGFDTLIEQLCFRPKPLVTAGPDRTICADSSVLLIAHSSNATDPVTYLWTGTGGTIVSPSNDSTLVTGLSSGGSPYRFIVKITDAIGCFNSDTIFVRVLPKPKVHAIPDTTVCPYTPIQLQAIADSGTAPFTFHWNPSSGLDNANIQNPIATVASTTTFCVRMTDSMGCPSSDTNCATITIFPKPTIAAVPDKHCTSDTSMTTKITISGGGVGATYSWTTSVNYTLITGSNLDSSAVTVTFPPVVGLYSFTAIVHDGNGCIDTLNIKDSVTAGLTMQLSQADTICQGQSTTLTASGAATYSWWSNPIDATLAGQNTLSNPTVSPTITTTYYVVGTNLRGCTKLDSVTIVVNITPTAIAAPDTAVCGCTTVNLNGTGSTLGMSYHWIALHGSVIANANILVTTALACQTDTFLLVVTDPTTQCNDTAKINVTVNPKPTVVIAPIPHVCGCSNVNLNGTGSTSGMIYLWVSAHGNPIISPDSLHAVSHICATDTFTLIITNPITLCVDSAHVTAIVDTVPTAIAAPLDSVCGCTTVALNGTGSTIGMTYHWISAQGNVIANANILVTTAVACVSDTFSLIVSNQSTGCRDTVNIMVKVNPKPTVVAAPIAPVCGCTNVNLTGAGSSLGMIYHWVSRNGNIITNPDSLNANSMACVTDIYTLIITNPITLCVDSVHTNVRVDTIPTVVVHPIQSVCGCTTVNLDGTGSTTGLTYHWTSANGSVISNSNALVTTALACVNDVFKLVVTNGTSGCKDSATVSVIVNPIPNAVIGIVPDTICHGTTSNITLNGTGSDVNIGTTYTWSANPSAILIFDSTALITTAVINQTTTFTLKVKTIFGCDSTVTKTIHIFPSPTISNSRNSFCTTDSVPWNTTIAINGAGAGTAYHWFILGCANPDSSTTQSKTFDMSSCPVGTTNFQVITVDGVTGCYDTLNTSVILANGVNLVSNPFDTICFGANLTLSASGAGGYLWSTGATTSSLQVSPPLAVGDHLFWVKGTIGGCSSTDTIRVHVSITPVTPAITGPNPICANTNGSVYTIGSADAGATYTWTVPGNGTIISGQGTDSITVNWGAAGSGAITVTEKIGNCTGATVSYTITVHAIPITSAITGPISVCAGATVAYSVTNLNGATFTWTFTNGTIVTGQGTNSVTVNWPSAGTGILQVIESDSGCTGTAVTLNVIIHDHPITSTINGSTIVCEHSTGELYDVINTIGSTYAWVITGGVQTGGGTTNNISVTWGNVGSGTVTVTETNAFGCSGTAQTINVTIKPQPTASITSPANNTVVCEGDAIQLTGTAPVGTIFWTTNGNGTFSNPFIPNPVYTVGSLDVPSVTLTMTVSNSPCPNATASVTLLVHPSPATSAIAGSISVCVGTSGVIDSVLHHAGATYNWIISNGTITAGQGTNVITTTWNTVGSAWIKVVETSSFGCHGDTMLLNVTVNPLPATSSITGPDTICENSNGIIYFVTNSTGSTYHWTATGGVVIISGQNTNSIAVNFTTTTGTITVQETNINGCIGAVIAKVVTISHTPTAVATGPGAICQGGTIPLTGTTTNGTIQWTTSGNGSFSSSTISSPTYTPAAGDTGITTLTMTVTNSPCADAIAVVNVIIHPTPTVTVTTPTNPICNGDIAIITATGGGTYFWSTSDATPTISVQPLVNTSYSVTVTSAFGCTATDSIRIAVNQQGYDSAGIDISACKGDSIFLNGTIHGAATGGKWTTTGSGKFYPNDTTWNATYFPSSADTTAGLFGLIFTSTGACKNNGDTLWVTLASVPTIYAGADQMVIVGVVVQLAGSGNFASTYTWTSSSGNTAFNANDTTLNATYSPNDLDIKNRTVTLILTATGGCRVVTDTVVIDLIPGTLPNVITPYPKTPGVNDYFEVQGLPPGSSLVVFNRWGEKVYEAKEYLNNWDAQGLSDGTYYYVLTMNGKGYKGYIQIIKD